MERVYAIENDQLRVSVSDMGAQLQSIALKKTGEPLLWEGDPAVWKDRSPWLFPVIGQLKGGAFICRGGEYALPMHGFAKRSRFEAEQPDGAALRFTLRDTPQTMAVFPWRFELDIEYRLAGTRLEIACRVLNRDDEVMFYSLGAHPGLVCEDGDALCFNGSGRLRCARLEAGSHLLRPEREELTLPEGRLALAASLFKEDAMIFEAPDATEVTLRRARGQDVRVTFDAVPWLGVWARPAADGCLRYVCVEPWLGVDDRVDADRLIGHKEGIQRLEPGEQRVFRLSIEPV